MKLFELTTMTVVHKSELFLSEMLAAAAAAVGLRVFHVCPLLSSSSRPVGWWWCSDLTILDMIREK